MAKMWAGRTDGATEKLADDFNSETGEQLTHFAQLALIVGSKYHFHIILPHFRISSAKTSGSKGIRSSACSPTPIYFTGSCSSSAMAKTMPPLAVPSSLVRTMPLISALSLKLLA